MTEHKQASLSEIPAHGGQLRALALQFGIPSSELLDFSASIHPVPPPPHVLSKLRACMSKLEYLSTYPDINYTDLKQAIATYIDAHPSSIIVGNGVMPLLQAAVQSSNARRCMILVPAFTEYRQILKASKVECSSLCLWSEQGFSLDIDLVCKELERTGADTLLLANPHSPSGMLLFAKALHELVTRAARINVTTIVDEAFIDYVPEESLASDVERTSRLIVLRSLTKFFAIPGLRVAYALAHGSRKAQMEACMPLWPVSTIAAEAARLMLREIDWIQHARKSNAEERDWLAKQLSNLRMQVYSGRANYLLLKTEPGEGIKIWRELITKHQIVVRSCANFEGLDADFLRVGIRSRADNERLVAACAQMIPKLRSRQNL